MKLLMDMQATQSEGSANRGIGRYTDELGEHIGNILNNCIFVYNNLYDSHKGDSENKYFYQPIDFSTRNALEKQILDYINDLFIKKSFIKNNADIVHIHSPFEGSTGKAFVISDTSNLQDIFLTVTLFDLIPLIFREKYLTSDEALRLYYKKLKLYYESDYIFAISDSAKEDAINYLGIPPNRIINISGAIDSKKFYFLDNKEDVKKKTLLKFKISQKYIMYTGGIDFRKNIETSIEAFGKIKKDILNNHQYVIVCKITNEQKRIFDLLIKNLNIPKNKIIFTNFVTDEELNILYNNCELFIFPSIYEGFGLPVLEAMSCKKAVIGSNVSSIPEIIGREDCMFDPLSVDDISNKINYILSNTKLKEELEDYFFKRSKLFSWENSAEKCVDIFNLLYNKKKLDIGNKLKIAYFSPLPDIKSGISDYSDELLPFLSKYFEIDIFIEQENVSSIYLNANFNIFNHSEFEKYKSNYDTYLYQFGNSIYHHYMIDYIIENRGYIVLHDFFIGDMIQLATEIKGENYFLDNLQYSHDKIGEKYLNDLYSHKIKLQDIMNDLPINKKIIESADGIIIHSNYSKTLFNKYYDNEFNLKKINQLIKTPSKKFLTKKYNYKKMMKFKSDDIIISAFGHISDTKQYDFILDAMYNGGIFKNKKVYLIFVGDFVSDIYKIKIEELIKKYKLQDRVKITGFVDDIEYKNYLLSSDIGLNLRINSRGETSRALLMNMAYGLPTIINDYASFSEFPDNGTCKIKLNSENSFIEKIQLLIDDNNYRKNISENGYNYILKEHNIDNISKEYYQFISQLCKSKNKSKNIIEDVANIIIEQNLEDILLDDEYLQIAQTIKKNDF